MQRKIHFKQRIYILLIITALLFATGAVLDVRNSREQINHKEIVAGAQQVYVQNQIAIETVLNEIELLFTKKWLNERILLEKRNNVEPGLSFFVFESTQLLFWSDNKLIPQYDDVMMWKNHELILYKNGWYQVFKRSTNSRLLVGLYLIKHNYAYQNKYIVNTFNKTLNLPDNVQLKINNKTNGLAINNSKGNYLFSIIFNDESTNDNHFLFSAIAYGLGLLTLFILCLDMVVLFGRMRSLWGILLITGLIVLRVGINFAKFPSALYSTNLFSPQYYASSFWLNSLGDLLLSSLLFSLIVIYVYLYYSGLVLVRQDRVQRKRWSVIIVIILLLTFIFSVFINYILSGLIINSQISFNINNVFELSGFSFIGITIIGILLFSFYLVCDGSVRFIQKTHLNFGNSFILFLITQGIFLLLLIRLRDTEFFINYGVSSFLLANFLILFISSVRSTSRRLFSFTRSLMVVVGFSLYAAQIIYEFNQIRERDKRVLLASKLENEQDLVAEYLFDAVVKKMQQDKVIASFVSGKAENNGLNARLIEGINSRLIRIYFSGYLAKYDVQFKYFNANEIPVNNVGDPGWNLEIIRQTILKNGKSTNSNTFYLIDSPSGRVRYLGIIPMLDNKGSGGFAVAELTARFSHGESGLPELLISDKINRQTDLTNYSYANYKQGVLISQTGTYNYYLTAAPYDEYLSSLKTYRFADFDNFSHLFYKAGDNGLIVLSIYNQGIIVFVTLFSYIFTFFSILFLLIYLLIRGSSYGFKMFQNFKGRIQVTVISIVVVSLVLVGFTTITYIVRNYTEVQNVRIKEKLNSLLVLIENQMGERKNFGAEIPDDLAFSLNQLAHTLGLDFNIYSFNGFLLFSSQPTIYEQHIMAPLMNREALTQLKNNQKAIYSQVEKIGSLSYIAAYESLRNSDNKTIGYLNLPYFARESDLKKEISSFLVALINIYVLLFSVAVAATFIISNRITRPLRIIQQGLKRTKLGKSNEPLVWKRKDEIGSLVNEYNRMVEELQLSAERLARSERESAWREMAKQVAHEIKNPLTPMKLSVQHLQRAWMDKHPHLDQMVERVTHTVIEQIETLASIATAFSDFAKMPKAENVRINLANILSTTVNLYSNSENAKIIYQQSNDNELVVLADKDHLLRIFSNLIKNALQSIPTHYSGLVKISVETLDEHYIVAVEDNGIGISAELAEKIFVPNFTTKTGGTGLGLAMVKSMVESMNGSVWFQTLEGKGTTFYVKLNRYHA